MPSRIKRDFSTGFFTGNAVVVFFPSFGEIIRKEK
jgi:hypothetical protein